MKSTKKYKYNGYLNTFNHDFFKAWIEEHKTGSKEALYREIATDIDRIDATVKKWALSQNSPESLETVERLASYMKVDISCLLVQVEPIPSSDEQIASNSIPTEIYDFKSALLKLRTCIYDIDKDHLNIPLVLIFYSILIYLGQIASQPKSLYADIAIILASCMFIFIVLGLNSKLAKFIKGTSYVFIGLAVIAIIKNHAIPAIFLLKGLLTPI